MVPLKNNRKARFGFQQWSGLFSEKITAVCWPENLHKMPQCFFP